MKSTKQTAFLLAPLLLLLFVPAFAKPHSIFVKNHNQTEFSISQPATLAGVRLSPGDYQLKWEGEGEGAQFTILKQDKPVGIAVGSVLNQPKSAGAVSAYLHSAPDGSMSVIRIETPTKLLVFQPNTGADSESR
jgi:hypothetical protein